MYAPYNDTALSFISHASDHVMSELKVLMCNNKKTRLHMDPNPIDQFGSDVDYHSTATSYCDDNAPSGEALNQFCKSLSSCLPLNNQFFSNEKCYPKQSWCPCSDIYRPWFQDNFPLL